MSQSAQPNCADCTHSIHFLPRHVCEAPQLQALLDATNGRRNRVTDCEGVRDFKHACGHRGAWFVPRTVRMGHD